MKEELPSQYYKICNTELFIFCHASSVAQGMALLAGQSTAGLDGSPCSDIHVPLRTKSTDFNLLPPSGQYFKCAWSLWPNTPKIHDS